MKKDYGELEKRIGYEFKDIKLLITALTHKSFANELKVNKTESYERLEFLGDAILEYIVSDYLFRMRIYSFTDIRESWIWQICPS